MTFSVGSDGFVVEYSGDVRTGFGRNPLEFIGNGGQRVRLHYRYTEFVGNKRNRTADISEIVGV